RSRRPGSSFEPSSCWYARPASGSFDTATLLARPVREMELRGRADCARRSGPLADFAPGRKGLPEVGRGLRGRNPLGPAPRRRRHGSCCGARRCPPVSRSSVTTTQASASSCSRPWCGGGAVGALIGLWRALMLVRPEPSVGLPQLSFGRLRPLHTNAAIFAFAGSAIFAAIYHSSQRLLEARMFSDKLSAFHFWGWQAIIVAAAVTLPLGFSQSKEYAELEWPIDVAITVVWVAFAVNFFGTIAKRRERHLYVAIWFYIATIVTVAILHVFNNL